MRATAAPWVRAVSSTSASRAAWAETTTWWGLGLARVAPCGGARLGVEVDDGGGERGELARNGEVDRHRRLAAASFLRDERESKHSGMLACWHVGSNRGSHGVRADFCSD